MCECPIAVLCGIGRIECMVNLALDVHADTAIHHNSKQGPVHVSRTN